MTCTPAAATGRYPKRRFRLDFERLVGLVLGIEDFYVPRGLDEREAVLFTRKVTGTSRPTSPMRPAAAAAAASSSYLSGFSPQRRQRSQSSSASLARSSSPSPSSSLRRRERPASALSASASSLSGVLPAAQRGTAAEEARLNRLLVPAGGGGEGGGQQPLRLTLAAADKFYDARSLLSPRAVAGLSTSTQAAAAATVAPPGGATAAARRPSTAGPSPIINVATYRPVVAWAAPLPPRSVQFPVSPLTRLRQSLRSTAAAKPEFVGRSRPLTAHFTDLNRTLGG